MEIFAPENLPGVGMGDLESIAAICGLLGLAVTSGVLVAEGAIGTVLFMLSALVVLNEKPDLGAGIAESSAVLALIGLFVGVRLLLSLGARRATAELAGASTDAPETKAKRASIARREVWAQRLTILGVIFAGTAVGVAWSEWNEVPFRFDDIEAKVGAGLGLVGAAIGGDAAWRFLQGAIRAGGSSVIVGAVASLAAYALNVASVYLPFVGGVVFVLALVLAVRLRRRQQQKYKGLRILS